MTETSTDPRGSLGTALAHAARLLGARPALAEAQAREILKVVANSRDAGLLLAASLRLQGRLGEAETVVRPLAGRSAADAPAWLELGLILAAQGQGGGAEAALRRAVTLQPRFAPGWQALARHLALAGDQDGARVAEGRLLQASAADPGLIAAGAALVDGRLAIAEDLLRRRLKARPTDPAAIRMLAEVAGRLGRLGDAETLLERCLELAPGFAAARENYALVLHRQGKSQAALAEIDRLLTADAGNPALRGLKAAALVRVGEYAAAIDIYEALLAAWPDQPKAWMSYGHALKTVGRAADSASAYRRSLALQPNLGEAWWSLANLKTFRFGAGDLAAMQAALASPGLGDDDRLHLHYALGKAQEDLGDAPEAFSQYAQGAEVRRRTTGYDPKEISDHVARSRALFTPAFFAERQGVGCAAPDPIFIVGLPRSGSTLLEQILASHPQVEGTMELPDLIAIAKRLGGRRAAGAPSAYPDSLTGLDAQALAALGDEYLARTRVQRKTGRPLFIDKMPNNWAHVGLIHLILPNARIIDARRHPLACGFSCFKQHFARGQEFTYDLDDIGRYYADYVALMAHMDEVLPGRVHRVIHEDLVAAPEAGIRRLLEACGLPFDAACLSPHSNSRAVRTASSEQVRRPITADGVDQWRAFEPWLGPLKAALGPVLETWRTGV